MNSYWAIRGGEGENRTEGHVRGYTSSKYGAIDRRACGLQWPSGTTGGDLLRMRFVCQVCTLCVRVWAPFTYCCGRLWNFPETRTLTAHLSVVCFFCCAHAQDFLGVHCCISVQPIASDRRLLRWPQALERWHPCVAGEELFRVVARLGCRLEAEPFACSRTGIVVVVRLARGHGPR